MAGEVLLPGEYGAYQSRAIAVAEKLVRDLEADPGDGRLLREVRKTLRDLKRPRQAKRVPKSEEVLRYQASRIRIAVAVADASEDLN